MKFGQLFYQENH